MIRIKRSYEPLARGDGRRLLVERLWPRGITKRTLRADAWLKDVAPSTKLRTWYGHMPQRWREFRARYRRELRTNEAAWFPILALAKRHNVTLLYVAHDEQHNGALVLRDFLLRRLTRTRHRHATKKRAAKPRRRRIRRRRP